MSLQCEIGRARIILRFKQFLEKRNKDAIETFEKTFKTKAPEELQKSEGASVKEFLEYLKEYDDIEISSLVDVDESESKKQNREVGMVIGSSGKFKRETVRDKELNRNITIWYLM